MIKIIFALIFLALFIFPHKVSAESVTASGVCSGSSSSLNLFWDRGGNINGCTVYLQKGNGVVEISKSCVSLNNGTPGTLNYGATECGTYILCVQKGDNPADRICTAETTVPKCSASNGNVQHGLYLCSATAPYVPPSPGTIASVFGAILPPPFVSNIGFGHVGINNILSILIRLIYIIASIVFVFMIVISAFNWITSGGDKEKVGAARKTITHAIIGITLLALSFFILRVLGYILGFQFFV